MIIDTAWPPNSWAHACNADGAAVGFGTHVASITMVAIKAIKYMIDAIFLIIIAIYPYSLLFILL